jgi:hypothetical protein
MITSWLHETSVNCQTVGELREFLKQFPDEMSTRTGFGESVRVTKMVNEASPNDACIDFDENDEDAEWVADPDGSYSEMVFRTNALDALNTGFDRQMADPDLQELFPAWVYKTAGDDRVGKDHRPKDGKYFPASVTFAEARGPRPFNCRCTRIPITAERWRKLEAAGAKLETTW